MRKLLVAVQFLTRIPVAVDDATEREIGRSALCFPFVGLLLGGILYGSYLGASFIFPTLVARILTWVILILLSGAFHLDGLADTVDGLYGGKDRDDALRIMKDPHIGAMGVIAIGVNLLLKAAVGAVLPEPVFRAALVTLPVVGHSAMVAALGLPYARAAGLGKVFADHRRTTDLVLAALLAITAAFGLLKFAGLGALLGATVCSAILLAIAWRKVRGVTGDICGAANEVAEIGYLLGLSAMAGFSFASIEKVLPQAFWRWHL
jgi:cobalamin 5'-phosphate synthase/cobalamin synthase